MTANNNQANEFKLIHMKNEPRNKSLCRHVMLSKRFYVKIIPRY